MKHAIRLAALLFGLWLGLSGHLEALLLALGAAATILVVGISQRMDSVDGERHAAHVPLKLLRFWIYLVREIIVANLRVIRAIVTPGRTISPRLISVPLPQRSDLGRVIYANSITLTPGTLSLRIDRDCILVHALTKTSAAVIQSGAMAARVPDFPLGEEA